MKSRFDISYLLLAVHLLAACGPVNVNPSAITPTGTSTTRPTILPTMQEDATTSRSDLPASATSTSYVMPVITPTATRLPSPATSGAVVRNPLAEGGTIWLRRWQGSADYLFYDLTTRLMGKREVPLDCSDLRPNSMQVLCGGTTDQMYLWSLDIGERVDLSIPRVKHLEWTPDGKYIYYWTEDAHSPDIRSLDLSTLATKTLASVPPVEERDWLDTPVLSADGEHLVVARTVAPGETRLFEINRSNAALPGIEIAQPLVTRDLAWSPVTPRFVFGASDVNAEFCCSTNFLYLYDARSARTVQLAAHEAFEEFFNSEIWSPDGHNIAVVRGSDLCVIDVDTGERRCHTVSSNNRAAIVFAWSPQGRHIAYVDLTTRELSVLALETGRSIRLAEAVGPVDAVDWR